MSDQGSVMRLTAAEIEPNGIPNTRPGLLPVCNHRGILLDRHVWSADGKVCTRCGAVR